MRRTTVSLPDDLAAALERESRRRSIPVSAIAREALAVHLGLGRPGEQRDLPFADVGASGPNSTGRTMESLIADEWTTVARDR